MQTFIYTKFKFLYSMIKKGGDSSNKGIRVLTFYCIFLALAYLMFAVTNQTTMIFGQILEGGFAVLINVVFLIIIVGIVHGLIAKTAHTYELALIWFGFEILNSLVSMYIQVDIFNIIYDIILAAFAFIILIDALIIWYIIKTKLHFKKGEYDSKYDKMFVNTLTGLMILAIVITFIFAIFNYMNITNETDKVISQLRLKTYFEAKQICKSKESIEKDICYLTLTAIYDKQSTILDCENIDSTFYQFTCIRSIQ